MRSKRQHEGVRGGYEHVTREGSLKHAISTTSGCPEMTPCRTAILLRRVLDFDQIKKPRHETASVFYLLLVALPAAPVAAAVVAAAASPGEVAATAEWGSKPADKSEPLAG